MQDRRLRQGSRELLSPNEAQEKLRSEQIFSSRQRSCTGKDMGAVFRSLEWKHIQGIN